MKHETLFCLFMCLRYDLPPHEERQRYESSDIKLVRRVFGPKRWELGGALCKIYVTNNSWALIWAEVIAHMGINGAQHTDFYSRTVNSEGTEHIQRGRGRLRSRGLAPRFQQLLV